MCPVLSSASLINTHIFAFSLPFSFSWSGNFSVNSFIKFVSNQLPLWDQHSKPKKKWPYIYMYLFTRAIDITCLINHEIWYGCGPDRNISTNDIFKRRVRYNLLYWPLRLPKYACTIFFRFTVSSSFFFYSRLIIKCIHFSFLVR